MSLQPSTEPGTHVLLSEGLVNEEAESGHEVTEALGQAGYMTSNSPLSRSKEPAPNPPVKGSLVAWQIIF